jgi:hypothetical protein
MVLEPTVARTVDRHGEAVRDENEATGGRIWFEIVLLGRRWWRSDHVQTTSNIFASSSS